MPLTQSQSLNSLRVRAGIDIDCHFYRSFPLKMINTSVSQFSFGPLSLMFNLQAGWVSEEAGGSLNALEDISIHRKPNSNPGAGVEPVLNWCPFRTCLHECHIQYYIQ